MKSILAHASSLLASSSSRRFQAGMVVLNLVLGAGVHLLANDYRSLSEIVTATVMAVKGEVTDVKPFVSTTRQVHGEQVVLSARSVSFSRAEVWLSGERVNRRDFIIEMPPQSLGVDKTDKVLWLLEKNDNDLWDFVEDKASYFTLEDNGRALKSLRSNRELWATSLWTSEQHKGEVTSRLPADPSHRLSLLRLGDRPWAGGLLPLALLEAMLDAKFIKR